MNDLLAEAVKTLHAGGVVAHPTETCYGLAADIFNKGAVTKVYRLKGMSFDKPVSILVRDLDEAQEYGEFSAAALKLALAHWPGPLTLVVPRRAILPKWFNPETDWIGIRVSPNKHVRKLLEAFGGPVTTTSANKTGAASPYEVAEMLEQGLVPDFVLDGGRLGGAAPSTLIKVDGDKLEVLREGPVVL